MGILERHNRNLIKSIQANGLDLRLILPFGLNLKNGDVVHVGKDGAFMLEGNCDSLLGMPPGSVRKSSPADFDFMKQSGDGTSFNLVAAGSASTHFPNAPSGNARIDVSFGAENSWLLAVIGRKIVALENVNQFRQPILNAYALGVWQPDWALVTSISTVERMTLVASRSKDTNATLALNGTFTPDASSEVKLTTGASLIATSKQITQCITRETMAVFCQAIRVRGHWFSDPEIADLEVAPTKPLDTASDMDFWENVPLL